jgi:hypothetical protein
MASCKMIKRRGRGRKAVVLKQSCRENLLWSYAVVVYVRLVICYRLKF